MERERLQSRIDDDWVLTDEEREKLAARLADDQKNEDEDEDEEMNTSEM